MSKLRDYETRRQTAFRRLGTDNPVCICGESRWQCMELHHLAGRKHHDDLVVVCRNCHRVLSDQQIDHPAITNPDSSLGRYLLGLSDLFAVLAERFKVFGRHLIETSEGNPPKSGDVQ